jgi:hypothetical protein
LGQFGSLHRGVAPAVSIGSLHREVGRSVSSAGDPALKPVNECNGDLATIEPQAHFSHSGHFVFRSARSKSRVFDDQSSSLLFRRGSSPKDYNNDD